MSLSQIAFTSNIQIDTRLAVEDFLEDFLEIGDLQLIEANPFYLSELQYKAVIYSSER